MTHRRAAVTLLLALLASPVAARADVVLQWNELLLQTIPAPNPFVGSRVAAMTHLAMFEAVNAVTAEYEPYPGVTPAPAGASAEAAAVAAAHAVLAHAVAMYNLPGAANLAAARAQSLSSIPDGQGKDDGIAVGEAAAAAVIALRANDGSVPVTLYMPPATTGPGEWTVYGACAGGVFHNWSGVTPFGVSSSHQFRSPKPPLLHTGRYAKDYNEVMAVGGINSGSRSADGEALARFYAALLPPELWNRTARQLAELEGSSLSSNARAFALLNMAMADALITVFDTKYHYLLWRPETAIRGGASDGNAKTDPETDFKPLLNTPCYPAYPSGHAGVSNAGRQILQKLWGNGNHSIVLHQPGAANIMRHYTRLKQIADDIDEARINAGIHFRFDQEAAVRLGSQVGDYIFEHYLRPLD